MQFEGDTIILEDPLDLQREMSCPKCANPISIDGGYKCFKCRKQIFFKTQKRVLPKLDKLYGFKQGSKEAKEYFSKLKQFK